MQVNAFSFFYVHQLVQTELSIHAQFKDAAHLLQTDALALLHLTYAIGSV